MTDNESIFRSLRISEEGGDYVHLDISDRFSIAGRFIVCLFWLLSYLVIVLYSPEKYKGVVALTFGFFHTALRAILNSFIAAPSYNPRRAVPIEPVIFLVAMTILKSALKHSDVLVTTIRDAFSSQNWTSFPVLCKSLFAVSSLSALLTQDVTSSLLGGDGGNNCNECEEEKGQQEEDSNNSNNNGKGDALRREVVVTAGAAFGSALTITGSIHNLMIALFMYDEIGWMEFLLNIALPILSVQVLVCLPLLYFMDFFPSPSASYEGLPRTEEQHQPSAAGANIELSSAEYELQDDGSSSLSLFVFSPTQECYIALSLLLVLFFGYVLGGNIMMVTIFVVALVFWKTTAQKGLIFISKAEYGWVFYYVGMALMTQSLNDTGIPQTCWNLLLGKCADRMFEGMCTHKTGLFSYVFGLILSPLNLSMTLASTFPYASPYEWVQVSFQLSMAYIVRSVVPAIRKRRSNNTVLPVVFLVVGLGCFSTMVGTALLSYFHTVPECSVRLGECGYP